MRIAIVGGGMAGQACAARLRALGRAAVLFDKGRGPGGRMSARRVMTGQGEAGFDHGAQYFTVRDPGFRAQVEAWRTDGVVAAWPAAGPECWVGVPAMNAPVKRLAAGADVRWGARIDALSGVPGAWMLGGEAGQEGPFNTVLLAVPAENAAPLLAEAAPALAALAAATPAEPCWTVMAAFAGRVPSEADVLREAGPIGWAARNSAKPGRGGPEAWVVQGGPAWSRAHLERTPEAVVPPLLTALAARVAGPLPPVLSASAHRWRYARSGTAGQDMAWDAGLRLGVCGDWLLGPRVECAWVSGTRLGEAVAGTRPAQRASASTPTEIAGT